MLEKDDVAVSNLSIYDEKADIIVSNKRSLEAASSYVGMNTCVLNFASATNPGGGVTKGSNAQEECLCRCSTLYQNLNAGILKDAFYIPHREDESRLYNDDCIYTPNVVVFKTDNERPELMKEADWFYVNVVTCAAPNLKQALVTFASSDKEKPRIPSLEELYGIHKKRIKRILDVAVANKNEVVILGAFGCGAFSNPPEVVAQAFADVIKEYEHAFRVIEFAIYCSDKEKKNYEIFKNTFFKSNLN